MLTFSPTRPSVSFTFTTFKEPPSFVCLPVTRFQGRRGSSDPENVTEQLATALWQLPLPEATYTTGELMQRLSASGLTLPTYRPKQLTDACGKIPEKLEPYYGGWKILKHEPMTEPRPMSLPQQLKKACDALPAGTYTVKGLLEILETTTTIMTHPNPHAALDQFLTRYSKQNPRVQKTKQGSSGAPSERKPATWQFGDPTANASVDVQA